MRFDRLAGRSGEDGMTLVELMVTMAITSILALVVGALFSGLSKTISFTTGTTDTTAEARVAIQAITQNLRTAIPSGTDSVAVTTATTDSIQFYTSLYRGGSTKTYQVTFAWNGSNCINETITDVVAATSATTCIMRTTTGSGTNADGSCLPLFRYFNAAGTAISLACNGPSLPLGVLGPSPVTSGRHGIVAVGINVTGTKATSSGRVATTLVQDRVTLANCVTTSTTAIC